MIYDTINVIIETIFEKKGGSNVIHFFNRKQLYTTFDMKKQADIKDILQKNNIECYTKVINRKSSSSFSSGSRMRTGTLGENTNLEYEYILFVKKSDFKEADSLIQ